nr:AAA family ATPase [Kribbella italica]
MEDELAGPDEPVIWTVGQLHEKGTNTIITAAFKSGKTTLMQNLIRSLVDSEPFIGEHAMRELDGRVAFWNFELPEAMVKRQFRKMKIRRLDNIWPVHLRGTRFDIMTDVAAEWTITELKRREIEVWIVDPFTRAFHGNENDNGEVGDFLERLDWIKSEAGVVDLFMPIHAGRAAEGMKGKERARGGSESDGWADNRWATSRTDNKVYFRNDWGRSPEMPERLTELDPVTNLLTYDALGLTRSQLSSAGTRAAILDYVRNHPLCSKNLITKLSGITGETKLLASLVDDLVKTGGLQVEQTWSQSGSKIIKSEYWIPGTVPGKP